MRKLIMVLKCCISLGAIIGFGTLDASAQESILDAVQHRGTLVVGVKADYPPFGYIDGNGKIAGFDIEVARYIAKKLGVGIELTPVTSANRIAMLQSKTVDMLAASLTITRQRWAAIEFSVPYVVMGGKFLVKKGSGIKGYSDLAGKVVAYTQGSPTELHPVPLTPA